MREMILNTASAATPFPSNDAAYDALCSLGSGMTSLIQASVTKSLLRMQVPLHGIALSRTASFYECILGLRRSSRKGAREAASFWLQLSAKLPLLADLSQEITGRFESCEPAMADVSDGDPLVLCAHCSGVAISVIVDPRWDVDELRVYFKELLPDASIIRVSELVDNLASTKHATIIIERHRRRALDQITSGNFWDLKGTLFPSLRFGLDVREQITSQGGDLFQTLVRRLWDLDAAAARWKIEGGPAPQWATQVTPESASVMNDPVLRRARRFKDATGNRQAFEWHARFGSSRRIHLRFLAHIRVVEIGYIGHHLPLA